MNALNASPMPAFSAQPATLPPGHTLPATLNGPQRQAVLYLDGPCLVLAGAGSGKTRVITQKIAYLLRECGYSGRQIVALTFTNKAAREMSERVGELVEKRLARGLTISTFHSLGLRFLREEAAAVGLKPAFSIMDATDTLAILQDLLATTDKARLREVQQSISLWKNALMDADAAQRAAQTPGQIEAAHIYRHFDATLKAYQAVDFDDLIRLPAQLLMTNELVRTRWQARVKYLLIDEYQDTNLCQYRLVQALAGDRAMFTAVGDDDQAIYAWRGATVENLTQLARDYPQLVHIKLEQNYRSVQRILSAANQVISHNPKVFDKKLWSDLGVGEPIQVTPMDTDLKEAESVAMRISAARFERRAQWRDFAVLYRSNQQARVLEQALRELRIPYTLSGGLSFFDKTEIRDVLAYLRLLSNEDDDPAFIRAITSPKRGVGQSTLQALGQYAAQRQVSLFEAVFELGGTGASAGLTPRQLEPLHTFAAYIQRLQDDAKRPDGGTPAGEALQGLLAAIQYEQHLYDHWEERQALQRWQNVLELTGWLTRKAQEDGLSLLQLAQHVALVTMLERSDDDTPDAVKLSTLHAAKGLEFPHVFLIGVEEDLLPHMGREDDDLPAQDAAEALAQRIQEERRLMYVGITRAQRSLHISWCKKRKRAREELVREPSRFIAEMGLDTGPAAPADKMAGLSPKERLGLLKGLLVKQPDTV